MQVARPALDARGEAAHRVGARLGHERAAGGVEAQHACEWHPESSEYAATLDADWSPWTGSYEFGAVSIESQEIVPDQAEVSVPEPGPLWLILVGLAGVFATARRREGLVD